MLDPDEATGVQFFESRSRWSKPLSDHAKIGQELASFQI